MQRIVMVCVALIWGAAAMAETLEERGAYLVQGIAACGNCHTPMGPDGPVWSQDLGGRLVDKNAAFTAIAPNITPGSRVAGWTDVELGRAIREGIRPDGSLIGPPMPYAMYRGLSDTDLAAIVAYLRSVPAVENDPGKSQYNIPLPPAYGPPVASVAEVPRGVTVAYGAYLAGPVGHCMECHTPLGPTGPKLDTDLGRGGMEFHGPWGVSVAANVTSHADGLGLYDDATVKAMIVDGKRADGSPMFPPMPYGYLARMTPEDLDAIVLYLRSLPPLADAD